MAELFCPSDHARPPLASGSPAPDVGTSGCKMRSIPRSRPWHRARRNTLSGKRPHPSRSGFRRSQRAGEGGAGEPAALIGIEDLGVPNRANASSSAETQNPELAARAATGAARGGADCVAGRVPRLRRAPGEPPGPELNGSSGSAHDLLALLPFGQDF